MGTRYCVRMTPPIRLLDGVSDRSTFILARRGSGTASPALVNCRSSNWCRSAHEYVSLSFIALMHAGSFPDQELPQCSGQTPSNESMDSIVQ